MKIIDKIIKEKNYKGIIVIGLMVILLIPILINFLAWVWSFSNIGIGKADGWLSFWGSYLGGVLGAIGVIGTTVSILITNDNAIETQDKKSREKDYTFYELNQIEEVNKVLTQCGNLFIRIDDRFRNILLVVHEAVEFEIQNNHIKSSESVDRYRDVLQEFSEIQGQLYETLELFNFKINVFFESNDEINSIKTKVDNYFSEMNKISKYIESKNFPEITSGTRVQLINSWIEKLATIKHEYYIAETSVKMQLTDKMKKKINEYLKK